MNYFVKVNELYDLRTLHGRIYHLGYRWLGYMDREIAEVPAGTTFPKVLIVNTVTKKIDFAPSYLDSDVISIDVFIDKLNVLHPPTKVWKLLPEQGDYAIRLIFNNECFNNQTFEFVDYGDEFKEMLYEWFKNGDEQYRTVQIDSDKDQREFLEWAGHRFHLSTGGPVSIIADRSINIIGFVNDRGLLADFNRGERLNIDGLTPIPWKVTRVNIPYTTIRMEMCDGCGEPALEYNNISNEMYCSECLEEVESAACNGCGSDYFVEDLIHDSSGNDYCSDCSLDFESCCECGSVYHDSGMEQDYNGNSFCPNCEHMLIDCDRCGSRFHEEDGLRTGNGDDLCPNCQESTFSCEICNETYHYDLRRPVSSDIHICSSCFQDHYSRCQECGDTYHDDDLREGYCPNCYDSNYIRDWNYEPIINFFGDDPALRYMGVELEIDDGGRDVENARRLVDICGEHRIHAMHDGSLHDGFELVSQPMTLEYHMEHMPWKDLLKEAQSLGYKSHSAGTCGIHVHMNRNAFSSDIQSEDEGIMKVLFFIERNWDKVVRFSRRTDSQLDQWAKRYLSGDDEDTDPEDLLEMAKGAGKYRSINLNKYHTVEIRIFRGTLKYSSFAPILQFVDKLFEVAHLSMREAVDLEWTTFKDMCSEHKELMEYFEYRGI